MANNLDSICYTNNPLKAVVVKFDFLTPIDGFKRALPSELISGIKQIFPVPESREVVAGELKLMPGAFDHTETKHTEWRFFNRERTRYFTISHESCSIQLTAYTNFSEFQSEFQTVHETLHKSHSNLQIKRFGMRYINHIELPQSDFLDWTRYLSANLLSIFSVADNKSAIVRAFNNLELSYGDFMLRFQYGMHNPDYPAPIKKKIFVLDYDAYARGILTKGDIDAYFPRFHEEIQDLFEKSILDDLRNHFNAGK